MNSTIMKKIMLLILATILIILSLITVTTKVQADDETVYLQLQEFRQAELNTPREAKEMAYRSRNNKIMWKIASTTDATGNGVVDKYRTIYCIKAGAGFGFGDSRNGEIREYSKAFNLKDLNSIPEAYKKVLPKDQNYNALIWVLEHCYVPVDKSAGKTPTAEQEEKARKFRENLLSEAAKVTENPNLVNSKITDNEIDVVQQLAVWYFTNAEEPEYHSEYFNLEVRETSEDREYTSIANKYGNGEGQERLEDAKDLLYYFITEAEKAGAPTANVNSNPISSISTENVVISLVGNEYIIGPYTITATEGAEYNLELKLKSSSNENITYKLLDGQKHETQSNIKDLIGQQFYLSVSGTENLVGAKIQLTSNVNQTSIVYRSVEDDGGTKNGLTEQPVTEIIREIVPYDLEVSLPNVSEFDLALRKFITKINDVEVNTSREPAVDVNKFNTEGTTVEKVHPKNPLAVETGDKVTYTIRIYNEGNLDGYAKEITDYLPAGLQLASPSDINTQYGWTASGDGKTVKTTYLQDKKLTKFEGQNVDFEDVEIECIVVATNTDADTDLKLKNIAEITKHSDEFGNENIVDRDSNPNNLTQQQKDGYNPDSSTKGWGYQDDDDFEDLIIPGRYFDLALRKFITNINGKDLVDENGKYLREPTIDVTKLASGEETTAEYKHRKDPIGVAVGDEVIYTIRVYNEGQVDGYAEKVTDYLPPQLEFIVNDSLNAEYRWLYDENSSLRTVSTDYLSKDQEEKNPDRNNLLKAFNSDEMETPDYKELKIKCRVKSVVDLQKVITNIAEITAFADKNGADVVDRDSQDSNAKIPSDNNLPDYKGNDDNKSVLTDDNYHYEGQQDDDDFEKLILQEFDLALRKFITGVNDKQVTSRIPVFTNKKDANGNYVYEHTKEPIEVETTDIVTYTIRIFNEGDIAGYAKEIKDDIPSGLEFLPSDETNVEYRWKMLDKDGNETENVEEAVSIVTDYLSKEQEEVTGRDNLIKAFNQGTMSSPAYKDVKVAFKVVAPNSYGGIITNIAQISDDSDENGRDIEDRDSTPDNDDEKEDDIDKEHIKLSYFDLALRKFITAVDEKEVTDRVPEFKIDENGKYVYEHTKVPVEVENGNVVTYTLRIYNEGTKDGYAQQIKDDLPDGLLFLPENEINIEYRWKMLDEDGNETENVEEAVYVVTDYLSKEQGEEANRDNLLTAFDENTMEEPNYRDIKIAFEVTEPNTSDRILVNEAQISEDADKDGKDVVDKDSTPDEWIEGEDDQDREYVKVKYFDLSLRKWVTQAILTVDGKQTIIDTGHKAEDDPEATVKVELVESKLSRTVLKFKYKIRITNEGEIAGSATEISDYIPKGLRFVAADNPKWKEVDGKVVTDQLKDVILQPGESTEVEIILTWINSKDNFGQMVNTAEISDDWNPSNTPDIDSTPNNEKPGEDDIDDAPVMPSIKTGSEPTYIVLTLGTLTIILAGAIFIKKFVL